MSAILLRSYSLQHQHSSSRASERRVSTRFRAYLATSHSAMVAFAPPFNAGDASNAELRRDLTFIRQKFDGLALYDSRSDTKEVLATAKDLHFHAVLLTVWDPNSDSELATAASLVDQFGEDMEIAVSLGDEGLMEKRYTLDDLEAARANLLARLHTRDAVEITTTEPWWLYTKDDDTAAMLGRFGDFTACNIHIVWDTDISDPSAGASWTRARGLEVRSHTDKLVLVRESGFPGEGRSPRDGSDLEFTRTQQADFWRAWVGQSAPDHDVYAVAFEAIDNPNKHWRDFEQDWGLLDVNLRPWPAWTAFPDQDSSPDLKQ